MSSQVKNKTCLLHIGAPKTGSTALQNFFYDNREKFIDYGLLYPVSSLRAMGHHDLAFLCGNGYPDWAKKQPLSLSEIQNIIQQEIKNRTENLLFSSEIFYLLSDPIKVKSFFESIRIYGNYEVKILVFIRRQDQAHLSWYNQIVKAQGYAGKFNDSLKENQDIWDYKRNIEKWEKVFGSDNIILRPYQESDLYKNDICSDFLKIMNYPTDAFLIPSYQIINTRINRDILEFQRIINQLPLTAENKRIFHKELINLTEKSLESNIFSDSPLINYHDRISILNSYLDGNNAIAYKYLNRNYLFDNIEEKYKKDVSDEYDGLSIEKLAHIISWLMVNFVSNKAN